MSFAFAKHMQEASSLCQGRLSYIQPKSHQGESGGADVYSRSQAAFQNHAEQLRYYRGYPHTIIRTICNRIAGQPFIVGIDKKDGKKLTQRSIFQNSCYVKSCVPSFLRHKIADYTPASSHPIEKIINRPNSIMTRYSLIFSTFACLELTGRSYWWIQQPEVTASGDYEIWPLPPSWVQPIHKEGCLFHSFNILPPNGRRKVIPASEMAYFFYPDPADPLGACSTIQALAASVSSDEQIELAQSRSFRNVFNPGLAVVVGNVGMPGIGRDQQIVLSADQRNEILSQLAIQLRGSQNFGNPIVLDGFIKDVKNVFPNPREMDFLNSSNDSRNRLSEGFGVNPVSMGRIEPMARASSAVADDHLLSNVVNPRIEIFNEASVYQVFPKFNQKHGSGWIGYIEKATSIDLDYDLAQRTAMSQQGAFSRNDWRRAANMPELEDGDNAIVGGVVIPVTPKGSTPSPSLSRDPQKDWRRYGLTNCKSIVQNYGYESALNQYSILVDTQSAKLSDSLVKAYRKIGIHAKNFLQNIASSSSFNEEEVLKISTFGEDWGEILKQHAMDEIGDSVMLGASLEWHLFTPVKSSRHTKKGFLDWFRKLPQSIVDGIKNFTDFIASRAYWDSMAKTLGKKIGTAFLAAAVTMSPEIAINHAITATVGPTSAPINSAVAAMTETVGALSAGQQETRVFFASAGVAKKKIWKTMCDNMVRPAHQRTHDQVRLIHEPYDVDGHPAMMPGDPSLPAGLRCGCRCGSFTFVQG